MGIWTTSLQHQFLGFLMVLLRVTAILLFAPVFGSEAVPGRVKIPLALVLGLVLTSSLGFPSVAGPPGGWVLGIAGEVLLGITIGFVGKAIVSGVQAGGEIIGLQMGFGIVNVIDPMSSVNISIIGQFYFMLAILVFLAINGHHQVLHALSHSFVMVPPGRAVCSTMTFSAVMDLSGIIFSVAIRVAAPVIVAMLLVSATTGVIARTIPQINFLIVGFAFRIVIGMAMLLFGIAFYVGLVTGLFEDFAHGCLVLARTFTPR